MHEHYFLDLPLIDEVVVLDDERLGMGRIQQHEVQLHNDLEVEIQIHEGDELVDDEVVAQ